MEEKNYLPRMMNYEIHIMKDGLLPFIFHTDKPRNGNSINWHENVEILCCISGKGRVKCGTKYYPAEKGDVIVIDADTLHTADGDADFAYHCLIVDRDFCSSNGIPATQLHFQPYIRDAQVYDICSRIADGFQLLRNNAESWTPAWIRMEVLHLLVLLYSRYASAEDEKEAKSVSANRVKKALSYIKVHLTEPISLELLADHVGISKYYFAREFKTLTGTTVIDYINILRCKEAKRLIEGGMAVSSAAISCGFENLSYFSRTFRKYLGQLPSEFLMR